VSYGTVRHQASDTKHPWRANAGERVEVREVGPGRKVVGMVLGDSSMAIPPRYDEEN